MKSTQSKIKPIKTGKELETMYCLGYKDFMHNFRLQEVKMTSAQRKIKLCCLQKCQVKISKTKTQKQKILSANYKTSIFIVKNVKKAQVIRF